MSNISLVFFDVNDIEEEENKNNNQINIKENSLLAKSIEHFIQNHILIDLEKEKYKNYFEYSFIYQIEKGIAKKIKLLLFSKIVHETFTIDSHSLFILIDLAKEKSKEYLNKVIESIKRISPHDIRINILGIIFSKNNNPILNKENIIELFNDDETRLKYNEINYNNINIENEGNINKEKILQNNDSKNNENNNLINEKDKEKNKNIKEEKLINDNSHENDENNNIDKEKNNLDNVNHENIDNEKIDNENINNDNKNEKENINQINNNLDGDNEKDINKNDNIENDELNMKEKKILKKIDEFIDIALHDIYNYQKYKKLKSDKNEINFEKNRFDSCFIY